MMTKISIIGADPEEFVDTLAHSYNLYDIISFNIC